MFSKGSHTPHLRACVGVSGCKKRKFHVLHVLYGSMYMCIIETLQDHGVLAMQLCKSSVPISWILNKCSSKVEVASLCLFIFVMY